MYHDEIDRAGVQVRPPRPREKPEMRLLILVIFLAGWLLAAGDSWASPPPYGIEVDFALDNDQDVDAFNPQVADVLYMGIDDELKAKAERRGKKTYAPTVEGRVATSTVETKLTERAKKFIFWVLLIVIAVGLIIALFTELVKQPFRENLIQVKERKKKWIFYLINVASVFVGAGLAIPIGINVGRVFGVEVIWWISALAGGIGGATSAWWYDLVISLLKRAATKMVRQ